MPTPCPDPETLASHAEGRLAPAEAEGLRAHLDECGACRELLITLTRSSRASPGSADEVPWDVPGPGTQLGRYRVTGTRGAGGMGVVVSAYDPQLDREVALKLLRPDIDAAPDAARQRLVREAQLMARVRHANVVTVHDVVVDQDRIFIAMELVDGVTVREWLEQAPRSDAEVLRVFIDAGRGLSAAHRAGVVHRDFKPDNVLLDASGQVLVSDFGLAWSKALPAVARPEARGSTGSASRASATIGTPAYMAPEQLAGAQVDAQADQFSFCVALFEALHGKRPFEAATRAGLLEAITAGALPAGLRPVSAHLDRAVRRGLSADPTRRFPSLDALLDALAAPMANEGAPPGRAWLAGAAVVVLGAGLFGAARLMASREVCRGVPERVRQAVGPHLRATLEERLTPARAAAMAARLEQLGAALERAWADRCASSEERDRVARTCLSQRAEQLELTAEVLSQPTTELRAAQALVTRLDDAQPCLDGELLTVIPRPAGEGVDALVRTARREALTADALRLAGKPDDARAAAERAVDAAKRAGWRPVEAEARLARAQALRARGAFADAEAELAEALLAAEAGRHFEAIARVAVQHILVVGTQSMRPAEAEPWVRRAEAALEQLPRPRLRAEVDVATTMLRVAQGDLEAALEVSDRALRFTEGRDGLATADLRQLRAQALLQRGLHGRALTESRAAASARVDLLGAAHPLSLHARVTLGDALARAGLAEDAKGLLTETLDALRTRKDVGPMAAATALVALGLALEARGDFAEALAATRQALEVVESVFGPTHRYAALAQRAHGERLRAMGRVDEALAALERAVAVGTTAVGAQHLETLESRASLALTLAVGRRPGAEAVAAEVLDALGQRLDATSGAAVVAALARALPATAPREARQQAADVARRVRGAPHPDLVRAQLLQVRAGDVGPGAADAMKAQLQVLDVAYAPFNGAATP
ncbi:MAG: serine/threonine protein kinase [Myxococcaceae bacterium]|nr:serine/threonine protein kinase [Myxococcaceae bacterium]